MSAAFYLVEFSVRLLSFAFHLQLKIFPLYQEQTVKGLAEVFRIIFVAIWTNYLSDFSFRLLLFLKKSRFFNAGRVVCILIKLRRLAHDLSIGNKFYRFEEKK